MIDTGSMTWTQILWLLTLALVLFPHCLTRPSSDFTEWYPVSETSWGWLTSGSDTHVLLEGFLPASPRTPMLKIGLVMRIEREQMRETLHSKTSLRLRMKCFHFLDFTSPVNSGSSADKMKNKLLGRIGMNEAEVCGEKARRQSRWQVFWLKEDMSQKKNYCWAVSPYYTDPHSFPLPRAQVASFCPWLINWHHWAWHIVSAVWAPSSPPSALNYFSAAPLIAVVPESCQHGSSDIATHLGCFWRSWKAISLKMVWEHKVRQCHWVSLCLQRKGWGRVALPNPLGFYASRRPGLCPEWGLPSLVSSAKSLKLSGSLLPHPHEHWDYRTLLSWSQEADRISSFSSGLQLWVLWFGDCDGSSYDL